MKMHGAVESMKAMAVLLVLVGACLTLGGAARAAPAGSRWGANYFPNVPLVTQEGKTVRFYDDLIKGKVVAISFIFTHCRDTCPAETANLRQVQKLLGDRVGRDVFFYSISIDPGHDTPKVLKEYAEKFKVGPGWTFLTGKKADITLLRKKLGLYSDGTQEEALSEHSLTFIVGNEATGQWIKRSPFDNPKVLARLLGESLHKFRKSRGGQTSYAQAPRLPNLSRGEDLFRSRCSACHSLGAEDGIGPGLWGVTGKRDRAWLARWLAVPDRMLAEGDAIATALFARYDNLPMPNLRLSEIDVEALIVYMESQGSARKPDWKKSPGPAK